VKAHSEHRRLLAQDPPAKKFDVLVSALFHCSGPPIK
jgi:hypothetical protein